MPEFNRNFALGLMNKDMDERLVPKGQYRDALNIEVSTSEGSNVGALETLMGNLEQTPESVPVGSYCVGSIVNGEENCIYYLVKGGGSVEKADYILKYNVATNSLQYVFVDIWQTTKTVNAVGEGIGVAGQTVPTIACIDSSGVRPGMIATKVGGGSLGQVVSLVNPVTDDLSQTVIQLEKDCDASILQPGDEVLFKSKRILNFSETRLITGINIVDDLLMFTDNYFEPKKINLKRSILGTGSNGINMSGGLSPSFHTRLVSRRADGDFVGDGLEIVRSRQHLLEPKYAELEDVTVIKKSPLTPPTIIMSATAATDRTGIDETPNNLFTKLSGFEDFIVDGNPIETGSLVTLTFDTPVDYRVGDYILLTSDMDAPATSFVNFNVRLRVTQAPVGADENNVFVGPFVCSAQSISDVLPDGEGIEFYVRLEQDPSLFEFKFPRFGYRYKYVDGEYSPFSPFSEVAFLPGQYEYDPKKGYNLAMANRLRKLQVKNYVPKASNRPADIVEIDILYKEEKSTSIYTVKTIKPSDESPLWPTFDNYTSEGDNSRGSIEIKSELIHAVVASNQLIRPWDNVPRKALAQEVTGNRLLYANYVQNYDLKDSGNKLITPEIMLSVDSKEYAAGEETMPEKSLKSMRTYQLGVVYKDEFGRETPVLADKEIGSVTVEKEFCNDINSLSAKIKNNAPTWAKSFKFFLKETAAEYYNLAMAKWYNAEDGNVWISFNSSDRNKIDIDTFFELKKAHDSDVAVEERARYKVIAIENEAPEDIRIDRQQQGALSNDGNDKIGDINEGFPFADFNFITLKEAEFIAEFGSDVASYASECSVRIQNSDGSERSEFYDIKSVEIQDNGFYKINIIKKFGPDVNFCSTADTYASRIDGLVVVIVKNKRVNKPEFDGKFFVKLYKDLLLEEYVMVTNDDNYVVDQAFNLTYIFSYPETPDGDFSYTQAGIGSATLENNPYNNDYAWGDNGFPNEEYDGISSVKQRTVSEWRVGNPIAGFDRTGVGFWHYNYEDTVRCFIDEAWAYRYNIYEITDNGKPENEEGNDLLIPDHETAFASFPYINGCIKTPTEEANPLALFPGQPDTITVNATQSAPDYISTPGIDIIEHRGGSGNLNQFAWRNGSGGIYSIGNTGYIDFSIVGIRPGYFEDDADFNYDDEGSNSWKSGKAFLWEGYADQEDIPSTQSVKKFIDRLTNKKTKFRFRQDPDKEVYTVEAFRRHDGILNMSVDGQGMTAERQKAVIANNKRVKYSFALDKIIGAGGGFDPRSIMAHDGTGTNSQIEFLAPYASEDGFDSDNPAVFETYPKENIELDIYYEISRAYPISLQKDNEETIALIGDKVSLNGVQVGLIKNIDVQQLGGSQTKCKITLQDSDGNPVSVSGSIGNIVTLQSSWGGYIQLEINANFINETDIPISDCVHKRNASDPSLGFGLDWFNCYSFGNGVESNRIRDDFNQPTIKNGVKASTTIAEQYKEERRGTGLIYSGIYNSTSGVNRLNQFIQGEKITKDINPDNGSIQKLFARDTNIVAFCEDRVLKILSDKDALFNADGKSNVTATAKVLGAVTPFVGDYGISKNPESFAADEYRCYFTDQQRGAVLRLSKDGLTPISSVGMKDYFNDTMADPLLAGQSMIMGSFDARKSEYNVTFQTSYPRKGPSFDATTISFNEDGKGWVSFKSFVPQDGVSINNNYYTMSDGSLWKHHVNETRNMFYGVVPGDDQYSNVTLIFNDSPSSVKNFQTVKYEGTQARINQFTTVSVDGVDYTDKEFYNLNAKNGWYVENIKTDMADGKVLEFINKENKWFNKISGVCTDLENLDEQEFQVQGIGIGEMTHSDPNSVSPDPIVVKFKDSASDVDGTPWD
tara:strand:- start:2336 stop:7900 length:5565 start_codon:yes stop_codon:yes gene_type:complete